jgi:hypothetical protein
MAEEIYLYHLRACGSYVVLSWRLIRIGIKTIGRFFQFDHMPFEVIIVFVEHGADRSLDGTSIISDCMRSPVVRWAGLLPVISIP